MFHNAEVCTSIHHIKTESNSNSTKSVTFSFPVGNGIANYVGMPNIP